MTVKVFAQFIQSVMSIQQRSQIPSSAGTVWKSVFGFMLSKCFYFFTVFGIILALDQINSDGFRCSHFKNGTDFLLSNETQTAEYLGMNFTQIYELKKNNGRDSRGNFINWWDDNVNGLLSEYSDKYKKESFTQKFDEIKDIIEEYNAHGFHDACNVLTENDVTLSHWLPPWFESHKATG